MPLIEILNFLKQNKYVYSLSLLVIFFLLSELVVIVSRKIILRITSKTKTDIDDLIVKKTSKPISLILLFIGVRLAILPLGLPQKGVDISEHLLASAIVILLTYIAIVVIDVLISNWGVKWAARTESNVDDQLIPIFHKFSRIFISIIGILFVLPIWGIQIGPLLASLGIAGIAVAFALQNTLSNIFGGASILADKSVRVGDKVKLDNEAMGTVTEVGLRSTKIKTWDGELLIIPNGKLAEARILNFLQPDPSVRIAIDFGVEYGSDPAKVRKIVSDALNSMSEIQKEPAIKVAMMQMGDFALTFKALFWVSNFDQKFDVKATATERIYNTLRQHNIGIPFPTRTVYMKKDLE